MTDFPASLIPRLARKELRETLRDRRTMITLVLMPVLLYPLLGLAFKFFLLTSAPPSKAQRYRLVFGEPHHAELLNRLLGEQPENAPQFDRFAADDPVKAIREGDGDLAVTIKGMGLDFHPTRLGDHAEVILYRRQDSAIGLKAEEYIMERLAERNVQLLRDRLKSATGGRDWPAPITTTTEAVDAKDQPKMSYLSALIPLVLVLMTITGAVYPAIDLTAGERERGTLEILMAAPIPRLALLLAKYVAVMTVAIMTGIINLTMMSLTLIASGLGQALFPDGTPGLGTIAAVLVLLLIFAAFFSAVLLAVTSFARSFKEAQAYLIPLMLLAISPGIVSLMPGMRLGGLLTVVPLINVVLLAREVLDGVVEPSIAAVVVVSTILYAFAAVGVAAKLFGAEAVLYSEQGHWSDMLRRPRERQAVAPVNAALLCLALMFPAAYLSNGLVGLMRGLSVSQHMLVLIPISVLLFLGIPLVSAYFSNVELRSGFQLNAPGPLALTGALLLGLSAWPFIAELIMLQEKLDIGTLPEEVRKLIQARIAQWRVSPWLVLLAMGVTPGLVEEFFFRGYLFNALNAASRPRSAIFASALLFGLFHLIVGGSISVERLLPSTLMGLLLGWVRWRSGSIWPGVLLHVVHNSLLVSAALWPGLIGPQEGAIHVGWTWLGGGLVGVAAGLLLVGLSRRDDPV